MNFVLDLVLTSFVVAVVVIIINAFLITISK